jgi:putative zinc finger protein
MMLLTCADVRRQLAAFYDRELPVAEMIAFEGHVKDCPECRGDLADLASVGAALRLAAAPAPSDDWAGMTSGVVARLRAENHESLRSRAGRMFEDMHLVWIALASTTATFLCGAIALGTLHFASPERHDSLAAVFAVMAAPSGSDLNPARLDWRYRPPSVPQDGVVQRTLESSVLADSLTDDTMLAVSAVVTREGGVADLSVLTNDRDGRHVTNLLDAISQARLQPAEFGGSPVAVNLVWILAQTTVKGKLRS